MKICFNLLIMFFNTNKYWHELFIGIKQSTYFIILILSIGVHLTDIIVSNFFHNKPLYFYLNSGFIIIAGTSLILYKQKRIKLHHASGFVLYYILINMLYPKLLNKGGFTVDFFILRESIFFLVVVTVSGFILSRNHVISMGLIFLLWFALANNRSGSGLLHSNYLIISVVSACYMGLVYVMLTLIEKSATKQARLITELEEKNMMFNQQNTQLIKLNRDLALQTSLLQKSHKKLNKKTAELHQSNKVKDKFFSIIAHDIKNPLGSMLGFIELLKEGFDNLADEKKKKYVELLSVSGHELNKLLENLLHWSRLQTGRIEFNPGKFFLIDALYPVLRLYQTAADNKQITIINLIDKQQPAYADFSMVNTIFRNLINNAIKYTNPKGNIFITGTVQGKMVKIEIKDEGLGMTKDEIKNLFKLNKNYSRAGTSGEKGTGLGLMLCHEFVELNQGAIGVESKKDDGANFWFTLPVSAE